MTETQIENICIHVVTSHQVPRAQPCSLSAIFRHFWPHIRSFPFGSSLEIYKRPPTTPHTKKTPPTKIIKHQFSLVFGGQGAIKPPQVTCWSVTKNLDILSPRSHGKNPDHCILMCPHVNNNTPMFTTILKFLSQKQLYDTVTFIGLINFFDFQDVYVTALMPTTNPWQH